MDVWCRRLYASSILESDFLEEEEYTVQVTRNVIHSFNFDFARGREDSQSRVESYSRGHCRSDACVLLLSECKVVGGSKDSVQSLDCTTHIECLSLLVGNFNVYARENCFVTGLAPLHHCKQVV